MRIALMKPRSKGWSTLAAAALVLAGWVVGIPASAQLNLPQNYEYQWRSPAKFTHAVVFSEAVQPGPSTAALSLFGTMAGPVYRNNAPISSLSTGPVLTTVVLPPLSLTRSGKAIRVIVKGKCAANANTKQVQVLFGSTTITLLNAAANATDFYAEVEVFRTGLNAQQVDVMGYANAAFLNGLDVTSAQAEKSAINVSLNLPTSTASNDVVVNSFAVIGEAAN